MAIRKVREAIERASKVENLSASQFEGESPECQAIGTAQAHGFIIKTALESALYYMEQEG